MAAGHANKQRLAAKQNCSAASTETFELWKQPHRADVPLTKPPFIRGVCPLPESRELAESTADRAEDPSLLNKLLQSPFRWTYYPRVDRLPWHLTRDLLVSHG